MMVMFTLCAGCMTGNHDEHNYWIVQPPEGVMGGSACRCTSPEECAGNGEKMLRSIFGDGAIDRITNGPEHQLLGNVCSCGEWSAGCGHDIPEQWRQHVNTAEGLIKPPGQAATP